MCHELCPHPVRGGSGIQEENVETPGDGAAIPGFFVRPEGEPAPAVLIIHDVWGANPFYQDVARRLAAEGFAALLPDLFVRQDPLPEQTRPAVMARKATLDETKTVIDITSALTWLRDHPATTRALGTVGFCMGGTLVMLAAAREPLPAASVAFYGFPVRQTGTLAPINPLTEAEQGAVRSPLLGLWGDQDQGVGMENVAAYDTQLTRQGAEHEFVIYPGLPHGFLTFDPSAPHYESAQDAWRLALSWLRARLMV
ncbi:MAG: dienelactone hydrolase family protein [Chloroflexota bacterium]|nr:dienelactone hydrolase family protein [Chloroflexota bacterium]